MVSFAWHESSDALSRIESFVEDPKFPERPLAASVASKLFFNLEEYDESLRHALMAGEMFDLNEKSQYVEVLIVKCMERYKTLRQQLVDSKQSQPQVVIDQKMEAVIDRMFTVCINDRQFNQSIGYALECRRLDKLRDTLEKSGEQIEDLMKYTHEMCDK
jgi:26S proteasome regulatory subunit N2